MNTDNLIIVCYPPNTGGKFLINCLGLSNNAFFQDTNLIKMQLNNRFTPTDKINCLSQKLSEVTTHWTDLDFSWLSMFNISRDQVQVYISLLPSIELFTTDLLQNETYNILQKQDRYFFFESHNDLGIMPKLIQFWPNAKIILFNNHNEKFLKFRNAHDAYDRMLVNDTTIFPLEKIYRVEWVPIDINGAIMWSADDYLNEDVFLTQIELLYNKLKLTDFNKEYIRTYYRSWINKLNQLSSNLHK